MTARAAACAKATADGQRWAGSPGFPSSAILTGNGQTYSFTFTTPRSHAYDCAVHGAAMSGTLVVR
jgi:plastocyanin